MKSFSSLISFYKHSDNTLYRKQTDRLITSANVSFDHFVQDVFKVSPELLEDDG